MRQALIALLTSSLFVGSATADVLTVNPSAGGSIQDAINAAAAGDTILVQGNNYVATEAVQISGKGLTLIGDVTFSVDFRLRRLAVFNVPVGQHVSVVNLEVGSPGGEGLILVDNPGSLRFQDCHVTGGNGKAADTFGQVAVPGLAGARIDNCADVVFTQCGIVGGRGGDVVTFNQTEASVGGAGMDIVDSTVSLFEGGAAGGRGGEVDLIYPPIGADGGIGTVSHNSDVRLHGSGIGGGAGGENDFGGNVSVAGGVGYVQTGGASRLVLRDSAVAGGHGEGLSPDGQDQDIVDGALTGLPSSMGELFFNTDGVHREGDPMVLRGTGYPAGTQILLMTSFTPGQMFLSGREGALVLGAPFATELIFLANSPAITFFHTFNLGPAPNLPVGFDMVPVFLQAIEFQPESTAVLGSHEKLIVLRSGL